jgi:Zn-finger nucleic acid-binding protein
MDPEKKGFMKNKEETPMKCPVCTTVNLVMSERQGVEIDYCPECRGVWLDRGELDKIIERAATQELAPAPQRPQATQPNTYQNGHAPAYGHGHSNGHKPYRKKSFLEELFD